MAEHFVYVDPVNGNDGTGAGSDTASTAASSPYKTLAAAVAGVIAASENNRVTKAGAMNFRLLDGLDDYTPGSTAPIVDLAPFTTSQSYPVRFSGFGSGVHNGNLLDTGSGAGYTVRRNVSNSGTSGYVFDSIDNHNLVFENFRIIVRNTGTGNGRGISKTFSYGTVELDRMLVRLLSVETPSCGVFIAGSTASDRQWQITNSVVLVDDGQALYVAQYGGGTLLHNTFVTLGSGYNAVYFQDSNACVAKYNYAHAPTLAAWAGASGMWDAATRERNASSDTSAYHATYDPNGLNNVVYSAATFESVTAGSEDLRLVSGSSLVDAASTSSETVDVEGTSRTTPDIGAYEYAAAASGVAKSLGILLRGCG